MAIALPGRVEVRNGADLDCRWSCSVAGKVHAVGLDADASRVAVAVDQGIHVFGRDGFVRSLDVPGGASCVAFGSGGRLVAGSASAATWLETEEGWGAFSTHERRVLAVARRGQRVLTGGADAQVAWTDLDAGRARLFQGHTGAVHAVALLPCGDALSASADGTVRRWETPSGRCRWSARLRVGPPTALAMVGDLLVVGGADGAVSLLDPSDGALVGVLAGHERRVMAVGGAASALWSVSQDRTARTWRAEDAHPLAPLRGHVGGVRACVLDAGDGWTGGRDGTIRAWSARTGREAARRVLGASAVQALTPDGSGGLYAGAADGRLVALRADGSPRWTRDTAHTGPVTALCRMPDGPLLSGGADGVLCAWDTASGSPLWAAPWHAERLRCMALGPEGRVATGGYDGRVLVGEVFVGGPRDLHRHDGPVVGVAWCGDAVVSGGLDGVLRVDSPTGGAVQTDAHSDGVVGVHALGPDRVASVGRDGWVRLWRVPGLEPAASLDLGVPLDGLGGSHEALMVGDRRGGVHIVDVAP